MEGKVLYPELSYRINGLCFKAHNDLGRFCREKQYADALERNFGEAGINYEREVELTKGNIADFVIEKLIILDCKAKKFVSKDDYYQMLRYLKAANLKLGLIVNFRNTYLKPKRVVNNEKQDQ